MRCESDGRRKACKLTSEMYLEEESVRVLDLACCRSCIVLWSVGGVKEFIVRIVLTA